MIISEHTGTALTIDDNFVPPWKPYMTLAKGTKGQIWHFKCDKKYIDQFTIISLLLPQMAMDRGCELIDVQERAAVIINYEANTSDVQNQKWRLGNSMSNDKAYKVESVFDGRVFDTGGASFKEGGGIWVWPQNHKIAQNFYLIPMDNYSE